MDFNKLPMRYWNDKTKIEYIQRRILVYSIAYYELNDNIVSDKYYDELSKQLVVLQKEFTDKNKSVVKETQYGYVFKDFDGSTGFDLYHRLNKDDKDYLMTITKMVLKSKGADNVKQKQ